MFEIDSCIINRGILFVLTRNAPVRRRGKFFVIKLFFDKNVNQANDDDEMIIT